MKLTVGYSKAPEQPQSSAWPIYVNFTMTNTGREPETIRITAYIGVHRPTHYATAKLKQIVTLSNSLHNALVLSPSCHYICILQRYYQSAPDVWRSLIITKWISEAIGFHVAFKDNQCVVFPSMIWHGIPLIIVKGLCEGNNTCIEQISASCKLMSPYCHVFAEIGVSSCSLLCLQMNRELLYQS